ncbi:hypothetical protein AB0J51_20735 [Micromonospora echinofusca]|uniref:hypothetical protein n=1 Tax=Micromonospora echinofusca TaxID=47858 RepID=UPI00342EC340
MARCGADGLWLGVPPASGAPGERGGEVCWATDGGPGGAGGEGCGDLTSPCPAAEGGVGLDSSSPAGECGVGTSGRADPGRDGAGADDVLAGAGAGPDTLLALASGAGRNSRRGRAAGGAETGVASFWADGRGVWLVGGRWCP